MAKNKLNYGLAGILAAVSASSCDDYDGGYTFIVPACSYELVSEGTEELKARLGDVNGGCVEIVPGHNNVNEERINMVFVAVNYTPNMAKEVVQTNFDCDEKNKGLLAIPEFGTNLESINAWYVAEPAVVQEYQPGWEYFGEESFEPVIEAASVCNVPRKAIIGLVNWDFRSNAVFSSLRSQNLHLLNLEGIKLLQDKYANLPLTECQSQVANYCQKGYILDLCDDLASVRGRQDPAQDGKICELIADGGENIKLGLALVSGSSMGYEYIVGHEEGHGTLGIRDEYLDSDFFQQLNEDALYGSIEDSPVNCHLAESAEKCLNDAPWKDYIGSEGISCFQGCSYTTSIKGMPVWRSVENGLMNEANTSKLGLWDSYRSCSALYVLSGKAAGACERFGFNPLPRKAILPVDGLEQKKYLLENRWKLRVF